MTPCCRKPKFQVTAFQQCRQLPVAVTQIEDHGERVVLLQMGDQEVQKEALAAARGAEHERVAHVLDMQVVASRDVSRRCLERQPAPGGQGGG